MCCFMSDEETANMAKEQGTTRAVASMERAAKLDKKLIFAIGNAPTALIRLYEMIQEGRLKPELIIGVPVGFVNVVQSKELILSLNDTPYIVARGRKGGSNIAACICNALLYMMDRKEVTEGKKSMSGYYFPMFVDYFDKEDSCDRRGKIAARRVRTLVKICRAH